MIALSQRILGEELEFLTTHLANRCIANDQHLEKIVIRKSLRRRSHADGCRSNMGNDDGLNHNNTTGKQDDGNTINRGSPRIAVRLRARQGEQSP